MAAKYNFFYLIHFQYLGFRYHGWFKQPDVKTVQLMVEKTLRYVLGDIKFKVMGSSRTDAMVSANHSTFELFLYEKPDSLNELLQDLNSNVPPDIRFLDIEEVDGTFNIIQNPKIKEYIYLFSHGQKPHPFAAPLMAFILPELDIPLMQKGALMFQGTHNFRSYCTKPSPNTKLIRTIDFSQIEPNTLWTASFFPEESFIYIVRGKGFMRNQIRLMMGQLIKLGSGNLSLTELEESLHGNREEHLNEIAHASGLILNKIDFE